MGGEGKKLRDAAVWLLTPTEDSKEREQAQQYVLRRLGVTSEQLADQAKPQEVSEERFWLWAEHHEVASLFCGMRTQWRVASGKGLIYVGLDYAALPVVMRQLALTDNAELFDDLQEMEQAALHYLNKPTTPPPT